MSIWERLGYVGTALFFGLLFGVITVVIFFWIHSIYGYSKNVTIELHPNEYTACHLDSKHDNSVECWRIEKYPNIRDILEALEKIGK